MRQYWVVDVETDAITLWYLVGNRFVVRPRLRQDSGAILTSALLPDFAVPLAELFR